MAQRHGPAQLFPLRVWNLYTRRRGPLLAAGNAYLMFFSVGAMLVAGFAIFGMVAADNQVLRDAVIDLVAESTPGLIDTGDGGLATPEQLLGIGGFGLTLVISLAALIVTALGWINGLREGIRSVLGLARDRTNPVLSKMRDAGTLLVLAVALVLTSALGALSTAAVGNISEFLGWGSFLTGVSGRLGSVVLMFVLDVAVAMVMFSMASRVRMPRRVLLLAAVFSGAGATVLRFFSAMLLNGVTQQRPAGALCRDPGPLCLVLPAQPGVPDRRGRCRGPCSRSAPPQRFLRPLQPPLTPLTPCSAPRSAPDAPSTGC